MDKLFMMQGTKNKFPPPPISAQVPIQINIQNNQNSIISNPSTNSKNEIGARQLAPIANPQTVQQAQMNLHIQQYMARKEREKVNKERSDIIRKQQTQQNNILKELQQKEKDALLAEAHEGDNADEFEEAITGDNFDDYIPCKFHRGLPHPDALIQSTSLSAVEPPDITYDLKLPEKIIIEGKLSGPQLETVVYASQKHEEYLASNQRKGFFLGDGAGVGKGRQLSGIIYENWKQGRKKAIWLSASSDLHIDARRDLDDIGANKCKHYCLNKLTYEKIKHNEGIIFTTYSSLIASGGTGKVKKTRLDQLIQWVGGKSFDGAILFDECHKAKNLCAGKSGQKPTKCGLAVKAMQERLPNARIVYCSATGCTEPSNMAYMTRLGLWGPETSFPNGFDQFLSAVNEGGIGMMELIAMHLKRSGSYICRTLSFKGCTFKVDEEIVSELQLKQYDKAALIWQKLYNIIKNCSLEYFPRKKVKSDQIEAEIDNEFLLEDDDNDDNTQPMTLPYKGGEFQLLRYFWGAHQRFFRGLCISLKVPAAIAICKEQISAGKAVIIGLQSTGESGAEKESKKIENSEGIIDDFISAPAQTIKRVIMKCIPLPPEPERVRIQKHNDKIHEREIEAKLQLKQMNSKLEKINNKKNSFFINRNSINNNNSNNNDFFEDNIKITSFKKSKSNIIKNDDDDDDDDDDDIFEDIGNGVTGNSINSSKSLDRSSTGWNSTGSSSTSNRTREKVINYLAQEQAYDFLDDDDFEDITRVSNKVSNKASKSISKPVREQINGWDIYVDEGWVLSNGIHHIGQYVRKFLKNGDICDAKIVAYLSKEANDGEPALYHTVDCDGKEEDLSQDQLDRYLHYYVNDMNERPNDDLDSNSDSDNNSDNDSDKEVKMSIGNTSFKLKLTKTLSASSIESETSFKIKLPNSDNKLRSNHIIESSPNYDSSNNKFITKCANNSSNTSINESSIISTSGSESENSEEEDSDESYSSEDDEIVAISGRKRTLSISSGGSKSPSPNTVKLPFPTETTQEEKHKELIYNIALNERNVLMKEIDDLNLPGNPLDMLIDEFGGFKKVAEMTGRKGRFVRNDNRELRYVKRSANGIPLPQQNIYERELFMSDKKQIAIISEAASSGISLHADRRFKNQRRRVHITLELPWSADKAIQQLGRSHRSNQTSSPEYFLLISPQGGERRFAAAVAKRLESLGALTQGDRSATVGAKNMSLSDFNFDTNYGKKALNSLLNALEGFDKETMAMFPELSEELLQNHLAVYGYKKKYNGRNYQCLGSGISYISSANTARSDTATTAIERETRFTSKVSTGPGADEESPTFGDVALKWLEVVGVATTSKGDIKDTTVGKFLNRLLGIESVKQNILFQLYSSILEKIIRAAKKDSSYDQGIMEIKNLTAKITHGPISVWQGITKSTEEVRHTRIVVDRGMTWEDCIERYNQALIEDVEINNNKKTNLKSFTGFYKTRNPFQGKYFVMLITEKPYIYVRPINVTCYRPITGRTELARHIVVEKYIKINQSEAEELWYDIYHKDGDKRKFTYELLEGSILNIWSVVASVYSKYNTYTADNKVQKKFTMRIGRVVISEENIDRDTLPLVKINKRIDRATDGNNGDVKNNDMKIHNIVSKPLCNSNISQVSSNSLLYKSLNNISKNRRRIIDEDDSDDDIGLYDTSHIVRRNNDSKNNNIEINREIDREIDREKNKQYKCEGNSENGEEKWMGIDTNDNNNEITNNSVASKDITIKQLTSSSSSLIPSSLDPDNMIVIKEDKENDNELKYAIPVPVVDASATPVIIPVVSLIGLLIPVTRIDEVLKALVTKASLDKNELESRKQANQIIVCDPIDLATGNDNNNYNNISSNSNRSNSIAIERNLFNGGGNNHNNLDI